MNQPEVASQCLACGTQIPCQLSVGCAHTVLHAAHLLVFDQQPVLLIQLKPQSMASPLFHQTDNVPFRWSHVAGYNW